MSLGYRGNDSWRDMSEYLVHLTLDCENWKSILRSQRLTAGGPFGALSTHKDHPESQMSCCLSEIPMDYLPRLAERHGRYGVVFRKSFIESSGGQRVWYLEKESEVADALFSMVKKQHFPRVDENDPLLRLTPFIDYLNERRSFEWEREWRVVGELDFQPSDVRFLFLPDGEHIDARNYLDSEYEELSGPDLSHAPMIDLRWSDEKIQQVLTFA